MNVREERFAVNSSMFSIFENLEFDFSNLINLLEVVVSFWRLICFMIKSAWAFPLMYLFVLCLVIALILDLSSLFLKNQLPSRLTDCYYLRSLQILNPFFFACPQNLDDGNMFLWFFIFVLAMRIWNLQHNKAVLKWWYLIDT